MVMPLCLLLLAMVLSLGRQLWYCAVLDKHTDAAARYLAGVPLESLQDSARRGVVLATAQSLVEQGIAGAGIPATLAQLSIRCGSAGCDAILPGQPPATVTVTAQLLFADSTLYLLTGQQQELLTSVVQVGRGN